MRYGFSITAGSGGPHLGGERHGRFVGRSSSSTCGGEVPVRSASVNTTNAWATNSSA